MCGISGLANFKTIIDIQDYYPAHEKLRHRGNDDEGYISVHKDKITQHRGDRSVHPYRTLPHIKSLPSAQVILGFHRLAIIDASSDGHQPMQDCTGRFSIVFNGEIYNYIELRQELVTLGYEFSTKSDTEVILYAYTHWGIEALNHFNGMWAFVIYDNVLKQLILSRDRFGIKPLYYLLHDGTLYFGSEVKFLLPFLSKIQLNENRAIEYLVQNVIDHHSETLFSDIYQILPGNYAIFNEHGFYQHKYYSLPINKQIITFEDACDELGELLFSSIRLRLRSDVPVGSLLSGGLDSTTIVCLTKVLLEETSVKSPFMLFSAIYEEPQYSERSYIESVINQTGFNIRWIQPDPSQLIYSLADLLKAQEFPFRSLSVFSQWELMRNISETSTKVIFDGQGSDEIFGGYSAHYYALIANYLINMQLSHAFCVTRSVMQTRQFSLLRIIAGALRALIKFTPINELIRNRTIPYLKERYQFDVNWVYQGDIFDNALTRNLMYSALPEYLRYEDRNSMAFTLESRLPFMDYRIIEWAFSIPDRFKIDGIVTKRVLRDSVRQYIPNVVYCRKDKMGFPTPQELWQHNELTPAISRVFDQDLTARFSFLIDHKCKNKFHAYQKGHNNDWAWIWRICCLTWWHQYWIEGAFKM